MTTVHKNLTGADLHEPKGADTATAGKVYVSNGSGSGSWTDASTIITNTAFTTGDLKPTHKTVADSGWIMWSDGTIGDGSSSGSIRNNADTSALFTLYWANANCLISGGKGGSAAIDYAAHKAISLPVGAGRALGIVGSGTGLTTRALGATFGNETVTLTTPNFPPYTPTVQSFSLFAVSNSSNPGGSPTAATVSGGAANVPVLGSITMAPQGGTNTALNVMNPMSYVNVMVKL